MKYLTPSADMGGTVVMKQGGKFTPVHIKAVCDLLNMKASDLPDGAPNAFGFTFGTIEGAFVPRAILYDRALARRGLPPWRMAGEWNEAAIKGYVKEE